MESKFVIPIMGKSLLLEFGELPREILTLEFLSNFMLNSLRTIYPSEDPASFYTRNSFDEVTQQLRINFILNNGVRLLMTSWIQESTLLIDFFDPSDATTKACAQLEQFLCELLGWAKCSSNLCLKRGSNCKLLCNLAESSENKAEILYNAKLIYREQTPFQELRVYDTITMGRILLLDDMVQISQELVDNYTIDMVKGVIKREGEQNFYNHILIIGGGDMLIAKYILETFGDIVNKITICEIDQRVVEVVKQYFFDATIIQDSTTSGKLEVIYMDGSEYAKQLAEAGQQLDGIIIDCTDFQPEGGVANSLFTEEFYTNIKNSMKLNAFFSQQLSELQYTSYTTDKLDKLGMKHQIVMCETPEYSQDLPLAYVQKID